TLPTVDRANGSDVLSAGGEPLLDEGSGQRGKRCCVPGRDDDFADVGVHARVLPPFRKVRRISRSWARFPPHFLPALPAPETNVRSGCNTPKHGRAGAGEPRHTGRGRRGAGDRLLPGTRLATLPRFRGGRSELLPHRRCPARL